MLFKKFTDSGCSNHEAQTISLLQLSFNTICQQMIISAETVTSEIQVM